MVKKRQERQWEQGTGGGYNQSEIQPEKRYTAQGYPPADPRMEQTGMEYGAPAPQALRYPDQVPSGAVQGNY